jgi:hypothetical protein
MDFNNTQEMNAIYRELVPEPNYPGCVGCHYGKRRCFAVHGIHNICICKDCIVHTSCTEYCEEHQTQLKFEGVGHLIKSSGKKIHLQGLNHMGYNLRWKHEGKTINFSNKLRRYMSREEYNFHYGK